MGNGGNENWLSEPLLIPGDLFIDDRGEIRFINDFDMSDVKRFYAVSNHKNGFIRAWHAHKNESKYVTVIHGAAVLAAVKIDDWVNPSKNLKIYRYILCDSKPAILSIPKGYANGFMTLKQDTKLIFFSTATLEESRGDDIRYDARYWDPWQVVER